MMKFRSSNKNNLELDQLSLKQMTESQSQSNSDMIGVIRNFVLLHIYTLDWSHL